MLPAGQSQAAWASGAVGVAAAGTAVMVSPAVRAAARAAASNFITHSHAFGLPETGARLQRPERPAPNGGSRGPVRLDTWISNTRGRREKLSDQQREQLGAEWATAT